MVNNIAVIFGGGVGRRMNTSSIPKQFLEFQGKAIIVSTLEYFQQHEEVDVVAVSCLESWIPHFQRLVRTFGLTKVRWVVPGGKTSQLSIYNALRAAADGLPGENPIALVHDAVRPLITHDLITENIRTVREHGSCVTTSKVKETIIISEDGTTATEVTNRAITKIARAPQSFYLRDLLAGHDEMLRIGETDMIDSCSIMRRCGAEVRLVEGPVENIKVTTPDDFYLFRALCEARGQGEVLGGQALFEWHP